MNRDEHGGNGMKFIIGAVFILGVTFGASGFSLHFSLEDIARHECSADKQGNIVFLSAIYVEDPLSKSTCGDMGKVAGIDL
jgi:hypothetical protein